MRKEIKEGDVVRYKADGTRMVVAKPDRFASTYDPKWECSWISDGRRHCDSFYPSEIEHVSDAIIEIIEPKKISQA